MDTKSQSRAGAPADKLLLTVPEAAERLSVSRSTLYALIDGGHLKRVKIGRSALVTVASLAHFVEQLEDA